MKRLAAAGLVLASLLILQGCVPLVACGAATGVMVAHDRRSAGTILGDQKIELSIRERILGEERLKGSHINVTSYNHIVLLSGEVPSREAGLLAERIARETANVRRIYNELVIAEPSSLTARANDSLITTGVKAMLLKIDLPGFDPTRVKVVTERRVVYLMGLVTPQEADAASEQARQVSGVAKVVRLFEIIR